MKIQDYINDRNKYRVDLTYQRPDDAWSKEDKQCLIDTIIKGEPLPIFFTNYKSDENIFYIVDGQQRLNCIFLFYENKLKLNGKFSGKENEGKTFNGENPLDDSDKKRFLNYDLKFHLMKNYDDTRVRLIFSRLQRGKPLVLGERLNAEPGTIVECMRELANHPFMSKSIGVAKNRYGVYPDAARILFYEKFGAKQCGSEELYAFFDRFSDLNKNSKEFKNALIILNYLEKCFPSTPGNYKYLEKHAWVLAVYTMVRELKPRYSLTNQEESIKKFIEDFHSEVYSQLFRGSNATLQEFYDNVRGGWSEKIIALRRDILIREFIANNSISEIDNKRQITNEEKIAIYAIRKTCELCGCSFKDYKEAEYHHKDRHKDGGKSILENIMILCTKCHDKIHGGVEIEKSSEEEPEKLIPTKSKGLTIEKNDSEPSASKSVDQHLQGSSVELKDLFYRIDKEIKTISSEVKWYTTNQEVLYRTSNNFVCLAIQKKSNCLKLLLRTINDNLIDNKNLTTPIPPTHGYGNITRQLYISPKDEQAGKFSMVDIMGLIHQSYDSTQ